MLFNAAQYLVFLPIVVMGYYFLPNKIRYVWLLAVSYYFYMQWNALYILLLMFTTITTYIGALGINKWAEARKETEAFKLGESKSYYLHYS